MIMLDINLFQGVFVPLIAPLNEQGQIDNDIGQSCLEAFVDNVVSAKVNGIIVNGATAEFYALNREQRKQNLAWVVQYVAGRVPVIANVTDNEKQGDFEQVLKRTKTNIDEAVVAVTDSEGNIVASADAVLLCPYYYTTVTNRNFVEFTNKVADYAKENGLPLALYNNPGLHQEKGNLPASLVKQLSEHENIIGIKDSSGDLNYFTRFLNAQNDGFRVFQGSERLIYESFKGEKIPRGIVPSLANIKAEFVMIFYKTLVEWCDVRIKGEMDESVRSFYEQSLEQYQRRMDQACKLIYGENYEHIVGGIKDWLYKKGIISSNRTVYGAFAGISENDMGKVDKITAIEK